VTKIKVDVRCGVLYVGENEKCIPNFDGEI
jgi:hypothetical protein